MRYHSKYSKGSQFMHNLLHSINILIGSLYYHHKTTKIYQICFEIKLLDSLLELKNKNPTMMIENWHGKCIDYQFEATPTMILQVRTMTLVLQTLIELKKFDQFKYYCNKFTKHYENTNSHEQVQRILSRLKLVAQVLNSKLKFEHNNVHVHDGHNQSYLLYQLLYYGCSSNSNLNITSTSVANETKGTADFDFEPWYCVSIASIWWSWKYEYKCITINEHRMSSWVHNMESVSNIFDAFADFSTKLTYAAAYMNKICDGNGNNINGNDVNDKHNVIECDSHLWAMLCTHLVYADFVDTTTDSSENFASNYKFRECTDINDSINKLFKAMCTRTCTINATHSTYSSTPTCLPPLVSGNIVCIQTNLVYDRDFQFRLFYFYAMNLFSMKSKKACKYFEYCIQLSKLNTLLYYHYSVYLLKVVKNYHLSLYYLRICKKLQPTSPILIHNKSYKKICRWIVNKIGKIKQCGYLLCNTRSKPTSRSKKQMRTCKGCKCMFYCSKQCQKKDWKLDHRKRCISECFEKLTLDQRETCKMLNRFLKS